MSQINIKWSVINMTRVVNDGFVIVVDWSCTASAPGVSGAFYGGQTTYKNDPSEPGFVPYDQLTEQIVLGWVFEALGPQKAEIEADRAAKVEKQLNPATAQGLPWSTAG